MTVQSEAEAVRQAKEYLDIGFVVNAIKRPDGSIAHNQEQLEQISLGLNREDSQRFVNERGCRG